jgi:hypothetical protein
MRNKMNINQLSSMYPERRPILKEELKNILNIENEHSLNQAVSYLVSFGIIKRFENGIYYISSANSKFSHLEPSTHDIIEAKYLKNSQGIRTGAYLLYKYKFTSQVSTFYEILSNNVSKHTRSKRLYKGQVFISYPPFKVSEENKHYLEFLEIVKHMKYSDFEMSKNITILNKIINTLNLDKEKLIQYSNYYNGRRYSKFRKVVGEIVNHETASWLRSRR